MSSGSLNNANATLYAGQLVLAGNVVVPGSATILTGDGAGSVAVQGNVSVSVGTVTNTTAPTSLEFTTATGTPGTLILAGNIKDGSAGGGGNWSYQGIWVGTAGTAYALNDVVFDTVNPAETYICILAYTTAAGAAAPSANATNWELFASNAGGGGGGIPSLTTTPATAGTGAVSTAFSAAITQNAGAASAAFTGSAGAMALAINVPPAAGGGIPNLATNPATTDTGNGAVTLSTTVTTTAGAPTAVWTGAAGTMNLALNIPPAGAASLPALYACNVKGWENAGTTDTIDFPALPAGTYAGQVNWQSSSGANPTFGVLSIAPVVAGNVSATVLCSGAVTPSATALYTWALIKLT